MLAILTFIFLIINQQQIYLNSRDKLKIDLLPSIKRGMNPKLLYFENDKNIIIKEMNFDLNVINSINLNENETLDGFYIEKNWGILLIKKNNSFFKLSFLNLSNLSIINSHDLNYINCKIIKINIIKCNNLAEKILKFNYNNNIINNITLNNVEYETQYRTYKNFEFFNFGKVNKNFLNGIIKYDDIYKFKIKRNLKYYDCNLNKTYIKPNTQYTLFSDNKYSCIINYIKNNQLIYVYCMEYINLKIIEFTFLKDVEYIKIYKGIDGIIKIIYSKYNKIYIKRFILNKYYIIKKPLDANYFNINVKYSNILKKIKIIFNDPFDIYKINKSFSNLINSNNYNYAKINWIGNNLKENKNKSLIHYFNNFIWNNWTNYCNLNENINLKFTNFLQNLVVLCINKNNEQNIFYFKIDINYLDHNITLKEIYSKKINNIINMNNIEIYIEGEYIIYLITKNKDNYIIDKILIDLSKKSKVEEYLLRNNKLKLLYSNCLILEITDNKLIINNFKTKTRLNFKTNSKIINFKKGNNKLEYFIYVFYIKDNNKYLSKVFDNRIEDIQLKPNIKDYCNFKNDYLLIIYENNWIELNYNGNILNYNEYLKNLLKINRLDCFYPNNYFGILYTDSNNLLKYAIFNLNLNSYERLIRVINLKSTNYKISLNVLKNKTIHIIFISNWEFFYFIYFPYGPLLIYNNMKNINKFFNFISHDPSLNKNEAIKNLKAYKEDFILTNENKKKLLKIESNYIILENYKKNELIIGDKIVLDLEKIYKYNKKILNIESYFIYLKDELKEDKKPYKIFNKVKPTNEPIILFKNVTPNILKSIFYDNSDMILILDNKFYKYNLNKIDIVSINEFKYENIFFISNNMIIKIVNNNIKLLYFNDNKYIIKAEANLNLDFNFKSFLLIKAINNVIKFILVDKNNIIYTLTCEPSNSINNKNDLIIHITSIIDSFNLYNKNINFENLNFIENNEFKGIIFIEKFSNYIYAIPFDKNLNYLESDNLFKNNIVINEININNFLKLECYTKVTDLNKSCILITNSFIYEINFTFNKINNNKENKNIMKLNYKIINTFRYEIPEDYIKNNNDIKISNSNKYLILYLPLSNKKIYGYIYKKTFNSSIIDIFSLIYNKPGLKIIGWEVYASYIKKIYYESNKIYFQIFQFNNIKLEFEIGTNIMKKSYFKFIGFDNIVEKEIFIINLTFKYKLKIFIFYTVIILIKFIWTLFIFRNKRKKKLI